MSAMFCSLGNPRPVQAVVMFDVPTALGIRKLYHHLPVIAANIQQCKKEQISGWVSWRCLLVGHVKANQIRLLRLQ